MDFRFRLGLIDPLACSGGVWSLRTEVWENQRRYLIIGWSEYLLFTDPFNWSSADSQFRRVGFADAFSL